MDHCAEGELEISEDGASVKHIFRDANLARASAEAFRAAAWFAEREFPERWGRQDRLLVDKIDLRGTLIEARRRARVEDADVVQPAEPPAE